MRATSVLVPPMSKVMILVWPSRRAAFAAPMAPPAGPLSSMSFGRMAAAVFITVPQSGVVMSATKTSPGRNSASAATF